MSELKRKIDDMTGYSAAMPFEIARGENAKHK